MRISHLVLPSNLTASNITSNSADINWVAGRRNIMAIQWELSVFLKEQELWIQLLT